MRTISFDLSKSSIEKAIKEVNAYKKEIQQCVEDLIRQLVEDGVTTAKMNVMSMNAVYTGELEESIAGVYFPDERVGIVYTGVWHALYVEYGTGIVGEMQPHPDPTDWEYDIHNHGNAGWVYYTEQDNNKRFRWTKGMPARPFMYNTMRWLEQNAPQIAASFMSKL